MKTIANIKPYASKLVITLNSGESFNINFGRENRKPDEPLNVYLKTWNDDAHLYLSIRDTGIGIKKEDQKKIFEMMKKQYKIELGT